MPTGQRRIKNEDSSKPVTVKKQKKQPNIVALVTPDGIQGTFQTEQRRPLIAHLLVKSNEVLFDDKLNNTIEPIPYDPNGESVCAVEPDCMLTMESHSESVQQEKKDIYEASEGESRPLQCFTKLDLMVQYKNKSSQKEIPNSVDIACFWCAHTFDTKPCIIPEREVNGVYMVYGNFCCPQCAFSYLLQETLDPHVRWERIALLHRIYDKDGMGRMFPAPCRESLKLFGGPLSIESYRSTIARNYVRVDMHMPPMVSILGSIDTKPIDFFDSSIKNTIVGGSLQRENTVKAQEGLRLKRTKPLKNRESTLDSVMNINIRRDKN
uniref:MYM-type domain-containing protein n=1 Tax=viral metagenome TaxID=1070528 RepID=A0A6C0K9A7_9ZZZZ